MGKGRETTPTRAHLRANWIFAKRLWQRWIPMMIYPQKPKTLQCGSTSSSRKTICDFGNRYASRSIFFLLFALTLTPQNLHGTLNRPSNNYFIKTKAIIMKLTIIACLSLSIVLLAKTSACAETLYGPGTIIIPTNQTIVINTIGINAKLYIDGQFVDTNPAAFNVNNPRFAIAGPHSVTTTDENGPDVFVTFQRVKGPLINTVIASGGQTNTVNVPAGK